MDIKIFGLYFQQTSRFAFAYFLCVPCFNISKKTSALFSSILKIMVQPYSVNNNEMFII